MPTDVQHPAVCSDLSSHGSPPFTTCPHLHFPLHSGLPPQGFIQHELQDFLTYQCISWVNSHQGISQLELYITFIWKLRWTSAFGNCSKCGAMRYPGSSSQPVSTQGTLQWGQVCSCDCLLHFGITVKHCLHCSAFVCWGSNKRKWEIFLSCVQCNTDQQDM